MKSSVKTAVLVTWALSPLISGGLLTLSESRNPTGAMPLDGNFWSLQRQSEIMDVVGPDQFKSSFSETTACGQLDQGLSELAIVEGQRKTTVPALWVEVS